MELQYSRLPPRKLALTNSFGREFFIPSVPAA
jgi:hypothetical protein